MLRKSNDKNRPVDVRNAMMVSLYTLESISGCEAAAAIRQVVECVSSTHDVTKLDTVVEVLATMMELVRDDMLSDDPFVRGEELAAAIRCGVDHVVKSIALFKEARGGRWPSMSGKALDAAACADAVSHQALAEMEELKKWVAVRISGALVRCDKHTYGELWGTFKLKRTLWGVPNILEGLEEALVAYTGDRIKRCALKQVIQVVCRVLSGAQKEMTQTHGRLTAPDGLHTLTVFLRIGDYLKNFNEREQISMLGPATQALACALGAVSAGMAAGVFPDAAKQLNAAAAVIVGQLNIIKFINCHFYSSNRSL